ncbi:DinB superfamily protein [Pedobacter sp. HMWF019]|uniref:DUF1572 family protein n=1 Tax=Pedobacter sp. HMWF019 TaxID=2056856 RepID=UPI000D36A673|nr:DUF1572 family protein [Pedobacter sp. HMWF019]PTS98254.1 DinB superfamily protein [Pedobacter sp. HMWF019]
MSLASLKALYSRDLNKLKLEIESYQNEHNLWLIEKNILNSAGNLCLHLAGNLNTYIGKELGHTGYVRDRDLEFSLKNVPRIELIRQIDLVTITVNETLNQLKEEDLQKIYPVLARPERESVEYMLIHLAMHLSYHLGQINYHRRLLDV